jgi:uncharacterized protein YraI
VPPRGRTGPRPNLNNKVISFSQYLRFQVAMVELSLQRSGHICGSEISMKYSLIHLIDYNRRAILISVYIYNVMHPLWFRLFVRLTIAASLFGLLLFAPMNRLVAAQSISTGTDTPGGASPFITVTYIEPVNVRSGPSTVFYPIIGQLAVGTTAITLGVSPSRVWYEIAFPSGPRGVGWVYAANVSISPGFLPVVEPPPTSTPLATDTIDPTLAAAFNIQPTATRLPTFTPPASTLAVPTFSDQPVASNSLPLGIVIAILFLLGLLVLVFSLIVRR